MPDLRGCQSDTAPHFSNGLCADCYIDEGLLEATENQCTAPLSAVIASVSFALIIALIAPKLAFSVPFVGLMARQPKPAKYEIFGAQARKHSKNAIQCKVCAVKIERGEYKVMLPLAGYKQNKPHCYDCAIAHLDEHDPIPDEPVPAPTPEEKATQSTEGGRESASQG